MKHFFTIVIFVFFYQAGLSQVWVQQPSNTTATTGRTRGTVFTINGVIYSIGGSDNCCYYPSQVYAYDTLSKTWTQKASSYPDNSGSNGKVGFAVNGIGYVGLGVNAGYTWTNRFFSYDPGTDTWTPLSNFPGAARAYGTGFTVGGKIYVAGGADQQNLHGYTDFYVYDPGTAGWTQLHDCPALGVNSGAIGFAIGNKGYIGTGTATVQTAYQQGTQNAQSDFWEYDPPTDSWTKKADVPGGPRAEAIGFALCDKGYVGGGYDIQSPSSQVFKSDFYQYDPTTDTWKQIVDYGGGMDGGGPSCVIGNTGYIYGGFNNSKSNNSRWTPEMWSYTPIPSYKSPFSICAGQTINFTDTTTFLPTTWSWSFAGGSPASSTDSNPSVTYLTAGVYDVTLTASTSCMTSTRVFPNYVTVGTAAGTLSITPQSPKICPGGSGVTLTVVGGGSNLVWSPSTGLNTTSGNSVVANPSSAIVYTVSSSSGCGSFPGTDTVLLNSVEPISVLPASPGLCAGETIQLTASGGTGINWSPTMGLNVYSGDTVIASAPTDSITYTLTGTDSLGCSISGQVTIHTGGKSIPGAIHALRDTLCQGTPGNLTLVGNSTNAIQWRSSTDSINFNDINGATDTTKYRTQPLLKSAWYYAAVGSGVCIANSDTLELVVPPALSAFFSAKQTAPNQLTFNSDSSEGSVRSYYWDFGDGRTSTESNPVHSYKKDSTYYICLTLYDGSNCSYTFCRYLTPSALAVPSIVAAGDWLIYPNPFGNQLSISSKQTNNHIQSIEMYDVLGRLMINENVDHSTNTSLQLDVSVLAKGMYFLKIKTADADYVQKLVKQ